ncbi:hypothetical protein D9M72_416790 [compost metagenome]
MRRAVVLQQVAVGEGRARHDAIDRRRGVAGDRQKTERRVHRRADGKCATRHHRSAVHRQPGKPIRRRHREAARLRQCGCIRRRTVGQVLLIDGLLGASRKPVHAHAVIGAVDRDRQRRRRRVAVTIGDLVAEGLRQRLVRRKTLHRPMRIVQRIGVAAVGIEHQRAVLACSRTANRTRSATERHRGHRGTIGTCNILDAVRAVRIRAARAGQHVAVGNQDTIFRYTVCIRSSQRHVVGDRHVHRALGRVAVRVGGDHLDRAEARKVVGIDGGMAGVVVVQRRRHRGAVAAAHQIERDDRHAAGAADDLRIGDAVPGQCPGQTAGVAERDRRDRIRTGSKADRAGARVRTWR